MKKKVKKIKNLFDYNDHVRIKSTGVIGVICDIYATKGVIRYGVEDDDMDENGHFPVYFSYAEDMEIV